MCVCVCVCVCVRTCRCITQCSYVDATKHFDLPKHFLELSILNYTLASFKIHYFHRNCLMFKLNSIIPVADRYIPVTMSSKVVEYVIPESM